MTEELLRKSSNILTEKKKTVFCVISAWVLLVAGPAIAVERNRDVEENKKISAAYSQHLFTSMCSKDYRREFPIHTMDAAGRKFVNDYTLKACSCFFDRLSKDVEASDITDYVMFTYSTNPDPDKVEPEALKYFNSERIKKIGMLWDDKGLKKKCGFNRRVDSLK